MDRLARIGFSMLVIGLLCGFSPPSGRPPIGPLERFDPKLYDFTFGVALHAQLPTDIQSIQRYDLQGTPIVMPIIFLSTFSRVTSDSVTAKLWLENREANPKLVLKSGFPYNMQMATLTIDQFKGQEVRWQISYNVQVWSSRIDDAKAAKIPWPEQWPKEVQDGLQPQMYIESDDPIFSETVERITQGHLKNVPPYLAAKELIRYCISQVQPSGEGSDRGNFKMLRGMLLVGAKQAAQKQIGTPHDLVCVCVAMLRAAGVPARPVIGMTETRNGQEDFVSWCEFFLPDAGWIPFDPNAMRGKGVRTMDVHKPWPEFGNMKNLNERIPLAFHFMPPATVETPRSPAVWGWDPRPGKDVTDLFEIQANITSRGKGQEDPS